MAEHHVPRLPGQLDHPQRHPVDDGLRVHEGGDPVGRRRGQPGEIAEPSMAVFHVATWKTAIDVRVALREYRLRGLGGVYAVARIYDV
jgi:hypothetical protein